MDEIIIWGEVLLLIDFSMDFCSLYFTYRLMGWNIQLRRLLIASALCAVVGLICTAHLSGILSVIVLVIGWIISTLCSIPSEKRHPKNIICALILFVFLEACAGGIMTTVFYQMNRWFLTYGITIENQASRWRLFFLSAALIFLLLALSNRILSNGKLQKLVRQNGMVFIRWNGHETKISCLFDSGNLVREPISGKHVMIVPSKELSSLGLDEERLAKGTVIGSRLIPMKTLDGTSVSWGILPEQITITANNMKYMEANLYIIFSPGTDIAIVPSCIFT